MNFVMGGTGQHAGADQELHIITGHIYVRLVAKYPSRDQATSLLTRKQALQLAAYLQLAAWELDE